MNGIIFLHTKSKILNFRTVTVVTSRSAKTMIEEMTKVVKLYTARGFNVSICDGDDKFDVAEFKTEMLPITINVSLAGEHVGFIEESICVVKERFCCVFSMLPYNRYPKIMIRHCGYMVIKHLNAFPTKNGASEEIRVPTATMGT